MESTHITFNINTRNAEKYITLILSKKKKTWIDFFRDIKTIIYMSLSLFCSIYRNVLLFRDMTAALSFKFLPHPVDQASGFHW